MGLATIATIATIASAAMSIKGGMESKGESKVQAAYAREEATRAAAEETRVAERQKVLEQRNIDKTIERQKLAYLAGGVTLEGSPLLKLEETRRLGAENIEEIEKAGSAASEARIAEGRIQAQRATSSGRESLLSGFGSALGSVSRLQGS